MKTLIATAATMLLSTTALAGEVRTERVTFTSAGQTMVGTLYLPEGVRASNRRPGVVVTGAWMTVKEQMPSVYARALAERGQVALTFDFRGWGESGGSPRNVEDPVAKTADIEAAASYLARRAEVRRGGVGALGVCASAGYVVTAAAAGGAPIRSVALVAPWLHNQGIVEQVYGGANSVATLIATGREAAASLAPRVVPAASTTDRSAVMFGVPYYTEADRGMVPAWNNRIDLSFWEKWLTFDSIKVAPRLTVPTFIVQSEAAALPQGTRAFVAAMRAQPGQLWLNGVSQFDFYDRPEPVREASDAVAAHFAATL
jgi:uncharacterized protein